VGDAVTLNQPKEGGAFGKFFCSARHPTSEDDWCRRFKGHEGQHAAYVHRISEPDRWSPRRARCCA
jgi:hypothetical protein